MTLGRMYMEAQLGLAVTFLTLTFGGRGTSISAAGRTLSVGPRPHQGFVDLLSWKRDTPTPRIRRPPREALTVSAANSIKQTLRTGKNLPIIGGMNPRSVDGLSPPFSAKESHAAPVGSQAIGLTQIQSNQPTGRLHHG